MAGPFERACVASGGTKPRPKPAAEAPPPTRPDRAPAPPPATPTPGRPTAAIEEAIAATEAASDAALGSVRSDPSRPPVRARPGPAGAAGGAGGEPAADTIGARVAAWRVRRGLSQATLATATGLSQAAISQIENGSSRPRAATVEVLAFALDVSVAQLYGERPAGLDPGDQQFYRQYLELPEATRADVRQYVAFRHAQERPRPAAAPARDPAAGGERDTP